jgi:hypothetical protein
LLRGLGLLSRRKCGCRAYCSAGESGSAPHDESAPGKFLFLGDIRFIVISSHG